MYSSTTQDVELNRQKEHRKITHGNDTDNKTKESREVSGNRPPGRPEKEEKPLRVNPEGLLVDVEGTVVGPTIEGTYLMPARAPPA